MKNKILIIAIAAILILSLVGGVISQQSISGDDRQPSAQLQGQTTQGQNGEAADEQTNPEAVMPEDQNSQLPEATELDTISVVIPNEDGEEDIVVQIGVANPGESDFPEDSQHSNEQQIAAPDDNTGEMNHDTQNPDSTFEPQVPTQPNGTPGPDLTTTYAEYEDMSPEAQMLFYYSFADADDFHAWYNAAKAEYEAGRGDIVVGDGDIDMEEIFKENER